ncbi:MAG: hypothetical protein ACHQ03_10400 [Candidatus Bathyarchaeia archaeon]
MFEAKSWPLGVILNSKEAEAFRRLRVEPSEKLVQANREAMTQSVERLARERRVRRMENTARLEPVYEELRKVLRSSPQTAGVVKAMQSMREFKRIDRKPPTLPSTPTLPSLSHNPFAPKKSRLRLGSYEFVFAPPFQTLYWQTSEGPSQLAPTVNGATGEMSVGAFPGEDASGNVGSAHCSCTAALGVYFTVPEAAKMMIFLAEPLIYFSDWWLSFGFREAAGEVTLTQSVNVFTPSIQFIANPIYDTHKLDSFDDRNLSDSSQNSGFNPAYTLSDSLLVGGPEDTSIAGDVIAYYCAISCSGNADTVGQAGVDYSFASMYAYAKLSTFAVFIGTQLPF